MSARTDVGAGTAGPRARPGAPTGTLYFRFLAISVPVQAAILLAMTMIFFSAQESASEAELTTDLNWTARHVSAVVSQHLVESNYEDAERFLTGLSREPDVLDCALYGATGDSMFPSKHAAADPPATPPGIVAAAHHNRRDSIEFDPDTDVAHVAVPIVSGDRVRAVAVIAVSTAAQTQRIADLRGRLVLAAAAFILAGVVVAVALARYVVLPVSDLAVAAGKLAAGDYDLTVATGRDDEIGALGSAFDRMVVNLRAAHDDLRIARSDVELILESMPDAVLVVECRSGGELSIVRGNRAAATLLGWEPCEMEGLPLGAVVCDADGARDVLLALDGSTQVHDRDTVYVKRSGELLDMRLSASRMRGTDSAESFVLVASDISKVRALEDQLRQSQKMEAIGLLAGGVAHDFNNLLSVILGYGEILRPKLPSADAVGLLDIITQAGERATSLVAQLLSFSRRRVIEPQPLDLRVAVGDMQRMLRRIVREDIELVADLPATLDFVEADPGQIEQLLMNLTVNARDAMPHGGRLTIRVENVVLDEAAARLAPGLRPGRHVLVLFSDTGVGMTPEVRDRAFEPFFTTKTRGQGTGLGLATVYGIVQQARGHIAIETELGHGTTFRIRIPSTGAPAVAARQRTTPATDGAGAETILVVEDEPAVRGLAVCILTDRGYKVLEAPDGPAAIALSRRHAGTIDLLLTDVVMPKMGGTVLAATLREQRPGLGVLYMSGYTDGALTDRGVLDADTELVQKPFTSSQLLKQVRHRIDELASRAVPV